MDNADETVTYFNMSINRTAEKLHNLLSVSAGHKQNTANTMITQNHISIYIYK